jgi:uncharacterized protein (DUF2235 family)
MKKAFKIFLSIILLVILIIIIRAGYLSYKRKQCVDTMGIIYQQRMIDSQTDKNQERATSNANEMLKLDIQGCYLRY